MSDSEDSDSFLSADEGKADAGNESSDITLSSDSESEEGGKAASGGPDSSDITLSSDDGDGCTNPRAKTAAKVAGNAEATAKDVKAIGDVAQAKTASLKSSGPADNDGHVEQMSSLKPGQDANKSSFSMSDVSSALSSSTLLDVKEPCTEQSTTNKAGPPDAADLSGSTETSLKTGTAGSAKCSNTSASPVKEAPIPQASQTQSTGKAPAHAKTTTEAKGVCDLHAAPAPAHTSTSDAAEGWGDLDEDITLPDDPATSADAEGETSVGGVTADSVQSAPRLEPAPTAPQAKTPPSSGPAAPEPALPPSEPAPPPSEPAPERRRPERRERRGPLKLGAKKLGAKTAAPPSQWSGEAAAGNGGPETDKGGGAVKSQSAPAPAVSNQQQEQDGWGSWEAWGSSLLSSAAGVTKTVLETVETGFGAPEPEDLARLTRQEQQQQRQRQEPERPWKEPTAQAAGSTAAASAEADSGLGLGSWFGGVSRVLGQTSSLVVNTGLDTLEAIGKKTMDVLQDDQLGIHGTISQLGGQKPSLSQGLREAREKRGDAVPCSPDAATGDRAAAHPPTFSHMFDQCDGTVHLEALEMLSARCRSRVTAAKSRVVEAAGIVLDTIEDLCTPDELEEVEVSDFEAELSVLVARLSVPIKPTRLIIAQSSASQWLDSRPAGPAAPRQVLARAVRTAAEVGAGQAEFLHKVAELRLVEAGGDPVSAGRQLAALAALVSAQAGLLAARFAETLSGQPDEQAAAATTDIYLEVSYLQKFCSDSLNLMAPVLQMAALNDKS